MDNMQTYLGQTGKDKEKLDNGNILLLGAITRPNDGNKGYMAIHKVAQAYIVFFHPRRGAHDDNAFTLNGKIWYEFRQDKCQRILQALNYSNFVELLNRQLHM